MNWDRIETSWAAMTRRVRPDWPEFGGVSEPSPQEQEDATDILPVASVEAEEAEVSAPQERMRAPLSIE